MKSCLVVFIALLVLSGLFVTAGLIFYGSNTTTFERKPSPTGR